MITATPILNESGSCRPETIDLSVVVPIYNEVDNVRILYERIRDSLATTEWQCEMLLVDDGSNDGSLEVLRGIAELDEDVRVVRLRRNYGQTVAMRTGIELARGKVIVTMDGDLQNDPMDIPLLARKIDEGYDLVAGWRRDRKDPALSRKLPSSIANWVIRRVTKVPIHDTGCSLKAYRRELIRQVPLYAELHRFIPAMSTLATGRFAEVVVRHHPRQFGSSKYGLSRVGRVMLDVITVKMLISSARRPLHWFAYWACPFFLLSLGIAFYSLCLLAIQPGQYTFVLPVVALLFAYLAVHLLVSGLFGDLVVRSDHSPLIEPLTRCDEIQG